jgi:4-hydroxybenzoate polyprenyltransferase
VKKFIGYLRLMRPANIVTAVADILAGVAIAGYFVSGERDLSPLIFLVLANIGLYGGGVVLNDFFDADLDAVERPERPLPSGLIAKTEALVLGLLLLIAGIVSAFCVSRLSGILALVIAIAAVLYDKWAKHGSFAGPLVMGICRGLSLLLGLSIIPDQLQRLSFLGIIPIIYIAAITMISQGEVHGGRKPVLLGAIALYVLAMVGILFFSFLRDSTLSALLFVGAWAVMVFVPLRNAYVNSSGPMIGKAVKAGVLGLILMDAAWAAAFGDVYLAFVIALLMPLSIVLAKIFAVT